MRALTHIAGPALSVDGHLRQRCAWCGAVIDDVALDGVAVAVEPGQEPGAYPTWPEGAQVRVDGGFTRVVEEAWDGAEDDGGVTDLAPDSCARLPHELTGTPTEPGDITGNRIPPDVT